MYSLVPAGLQIRACIILPNSSSPQPLCTTTRSQHLAVPAGAPPITTTTQVTFLLEVVSTNKKKVEVRFRDRIANGHLACSSGTPAFALPPGVVLPTNTWFGNPFRVALTVTCASPGADTILYEFIEYRVWHTWSTPQPLPLCIDVNIV
jgi:hypothetical protein